MKQLLHSLSIEILSKNWEDCLLDELKDLSEAHPYAGTLQLLYALKLKQENKAEFAQQWQKTLLYFDNPLWVNHAFTEMKETEVAENKSVTTDSVSEELLENPVTTSGEPTVQETPLPQFKIEKAAPQQAEMLFTPYYMVDYFASQGIKLGEVEGADRFGNQLKSFTEWLKQMRRLPEAEKATRFYPGEEKKVENMAASSITGEEAITAAMAEVWAKQNNPEKAIAVYQKLSLLNPSKSAFFAAKIEHLKKLL